MSTRAVGRMRDLIEEDTCDCREATSWRILTSSPHVWDLISEWSEWCERGRARDVSNAFSGPEGYWRLKAGAPSYDELERRRNTVEIPEWAKAGNARLAQRREAAA